MTSRSELDGCGSRSTTSGRSRTRGSLLAATLAARLGIERLVDETVRGLRGIGRGRRSAGRKVMTLVHAIALGADSIDDCDAAAGRADGLVLGHWIVAPSTLGTFLRAFTFGHVRQLDRVLAESLRGRGGRAPAPARERLVIDVDSFVGEVHGYEKQGAALRVHAPARLSPARWPRAQRRGELLHVRLRKGSANSQRGDRSASPTS